MIHLLVLLGIGSLAVLALAIHFLPALIAWNRNHPNKVAILLVNLFLGWTIIAWIITLIWSLSTPVAVAVAYPGGPYGQPYPGYPATGQPGQPQVLPPAPPYAGPR